MLSKCHYCWISKQLQSSIVLEIENYKNQGLLNRFVNNVYLITELSRVFEMSLNLLWPNNTV